MSNLPSYDYRPAKTIKPALPSVNISRARRIVSNLMFRSIEFGAQGNHIGTVMITHLNQGFVIIQNTNVLPTSEVLVNNLPYDHVVKLESGILNLYQNTFFNGLLLLTSVNARLGVNKIGQLTLKLSSLDNHEYLPMIEVFSIEKKSFVDSITNQTRYYWDKAGVTALINASSKLVKVLYAGEDVHFDVNDSNLGFVRNQRQIPPRSPTESLEPFPFGKLSNGTGYPELTFVDTGPTRSLVHVNYSEREEDGLAMVINQIHEWNGTSVTDGKWTVKSS